MQDSMKVATSISPVVTDRDRRVSLDQGGDNCESATIVSSLPFFATGTTDGYADDIATPCPDANGFSPDVVYFFSSPMDILVDISLCGSSFDTRLLVFEQSCETPVFACNDNACLASSMLPVASGIFNLAVSAGREYYIVVDGSGGESGVYSFSMMASQSCAPLPETDDCENASMEQLPFAYSGDNSCATYDCEAFPARNVWVAFEVTECSDVTLSYCGTSPAFGNAWLNLAAGCPCEAITAPATIESDYCGDGNFALTWYMLSAGLYYYPVMMDPLNGAVGPFSVQVTAVVRTPCEVCSTSTGQDEEPECTDDFEDTFNSGCDGVNATFTGLSSGDRVCGSLGSFRERERAGFVDTDWYQFDVQMNSHVVLCLAAEHPVTGVLFFPLNGCLDLVPLNATTIGRCSVVCDSVVLDSGIYWFSVTPQFTAGIPCSSRYQLGLTISAIIPCEAEPSTCAGGSPETEPNQPCGIASDPTRLDCGSSLAATICPVGDSDVYHWVIPEFHRSTIQVFSEFGGQCDAQPASVVLEILDPANCSVVPASQTSTGWTITGPAEHVVRVSSAIAEGVGEYRIEAACELLTPCEAQCSLAPRVEFEQDLLFNSCNGCSLYPGNDEYDCSGPDWLSGPQVFAQFDLGVPAYVCIDLRGDTLVIPGGLDVQFKVFTDYFDPSSSCIYSSDLNYPGSEVTGSFYTESGCENFSAGTYFIGMSSYDVSGSGLTCAPMTLRVSLSTTDCNAPLDLRGLFMASSNGVMLNWYSAEASEFRVWSTSSSNNDGNPDGGADPQWTLLGTVTSLPGLATFLDSSPLTQYRAFVVTRVCP